MTLREWSERTGILPTHPTTERGAVSVVIDFNHPDRPELWRLSDYKVSSAGMVIWLVPVPCLEDRVNRKIQDLIDALEAMKL